MTIQSGFQQRKAQNPESATWAGAPLAPAEIETILNAEPRGICITDPKGICRFVSSPLCNLLGYSCDEMLNCPVTLFVPGFPELSARERRGSSHHVEHRITRRDGENFPADIELCELNAMGELMGFALFVTNLSEAKHAEEVLQKTERLASAGRMAAAIAHEINNPLEAVTNLLFLLRNQDLGSDAMHLLSLVDSEIERVSRIARRTLAFYRDTGKPTRVDLRELLNLSVDVQGMRKPGLKIHRRYRTTQTISGYASELQQVFHNLVSNSVEAGATDLWLRLHQSNPSDHARRRGIQITIADNGCGIDPAVQSRIFNPFITTKGEKGTGLGLWVSRGIILRHEGGIRVRTSTRPGRSGTCMSIFLPR